VGTALVRILAAELEPRRPERRELRAVKRRPKAWVLLAKPPPQSKGNSSLDERVRARNFGAARSRAEISASMIERVTAP
jgi:hypothetical protein